MMTVRDLLDACFSVRVKFKATVLYKEADALDAELARLREENATLNAFIDFTAKNYAGLRNDALEEAAKVLLDIDDTPGTHEWTLAKAIRALKTPAPVAGDGGAE